MLLLISKGIMSYIGGIFMIASNSIFVMPITDNKEMMEGKRHKHSRKTRITLRESLPACFSFHCFFFLQLPCLTVFTIVLFAHTGKFVVLSLPILLSHVTVTIRPQSTSGNSNIRHDIFHRKVGVNFEF